MTNNQLIGMPGLPQLGAVREDAPEVLPVIRSNGEVSRRTDVARIPVSLLNAVGRSQCIPSVQEIVANYACARDTAEQWQNWLRNNRKAWRHG